MDSSDEFFFNNVINTSSDESDVDTKVMVLVALLVHDFNENQVPKRGGR